MNATRLDTALKHPASLPEGLMDHARELLSLNRGLQAWLAPMPWATAVKLANFRAPTATLILSSAAVATPLRYRQKEILAWLGEQTGTRFTQLEINIRA